MTAVAIPELHFDAPLVNPAPSGLYAATNFIDYGPDDPQRFLGQGVSIRVHNYGGLNAFGLWDAEWCADPGGDTKSGERPVIDGPPFPPMVPWAYDQCDLSAPSRAEVLARAAQNLRLLEQTAVETEFAARMLADATEVAALPSKTDLVGALGYLEGLFAITNTVGLIHASPEVAANAAYHQLIIRSGNGLKTPMGHTWVFGGGYVDGLGAQKLVATSPTFGWRGQAEVRETIYHEQNEFIAIAERAVVIGYEMLIGGATFSG